MMMFIYEPLLDRLLDGSLYPALPVVPVQYSIPFYELLKIANMLTRHVS